MTPRQEAVRDALDALATVHEDIHPLAVISIVDGLLWDVRSGPRRGAWAAVAQSYQDLRDYRAGSACPSRFGWHGADAGRRCEQMLAHQYAAALDHASGLVVPVALTASRRSRG